MLQQSKSTFKGGTLREYLGGTGPSTDLKPKRENLLGGSMLRFIARWHDCIACD